MARNILRGRPPALSLKLMPMVKRTCTIRAERAWTAGNVEAANEDRYVPAEQQSLHHLVAYQPGHGSIRPYISPQVTCSSWIATEGWKHGSHNFDLDRVSAYKYVHRWISCCPNCFSSYHLCPHQLHGMAILPAHLVLPSLLLYMTSALEVLPEPESLPPLSPDAQERSLDVLNVLLGRQNTCYSPNAWCASKSSVISHAIRKRC